MTLVRGGATAGSARYLAECLGMGSNDGLQSLQPLQAAWRGWALGLEWN